MSLPDKFKFKYVRRNGDVRDEIYTAVLYDDIDESGYRITWDSGTTTFSIKSAECHIKEGHWIILPTSEDKEEASVFEQIRNFCKSTNSYVAVMGDGFEVHYDNFHKPVIAKDEEEMLEVMEAISVLHGTKNGN